MPLVGGKTFPYTSAGMKKAEGYAQKMKKGLQVDDNIYGESNKTSMRKNKSTLSTPRKPNATMRKRKNARNLKPYKTNRKMGY